MTERTRRPRPANTAQADPPRRARSPFALTPPPPNVERTPPSGVPLANARHETFAQLVAQRRPIAEAYSGAGYGGAPAGAARLLADPRISGRIAALQTAGAERAVVTIESLVAELEEARELGRTNNQAAAMVAATREKAVLLGLRVEKRDTTTRAGDPKGLTDDELAAIARAGSDGVDPTESDPERPNGVVH